MAATSRSSARRPIVRASAASSARSAATGVAMPRGTPVEPEVSLTTAMPGRLTARAEPAPGSQEVSQSSTAAGQEVRQRSRAEAPSARATRDASAGGAWPSISTAARSARRSASSEARRPGPLCAETATSAPGGNPPRGAGAASAAGGACAGAGAGWGAGSSKLRRAARASASTSATVARREPDSTSGASGWRRARLAKASSKGSRGWRRGRAQPLSSPRGALRVGAWIKMRVVSEREPILPPSLARTGESGARCHYRRADRDCQRRSVTVA